MKKKRERMLDRLNPRRIFRSPGFRSAILKLCGAAAVCLMLFPVFWYAFLPYCAEVPADAFADRRSSCIYYDKMGIPVHSEPGSNARIHFPVKLSDLPQHLIDATLAAEDRRFYEHDGADLHAIFRAAWQLIKNGRIISGGSTITMQLVSMRNEQACKSRSWRDKFIQTAEAKNYELSHTKEEILEKYFNELPYGGRIYGIGAAAEYYFGRHVSQLNLAESILLCGLPQAPSRLRPDRHPERARKRFETIITMLQEQGYFTESAAAAVRAEPLRYRDFSLPFLPNADDPIFFQQAKKQNNGGQLHIYTTYDPDMTQTALEILKKDLPRDGTVQDAAMVVIENATGKVRVMIGTLDFQRQPDGQVNAATAMRSPGSLLKPFFYGEALTGGMIGPDTLLDDSPLTIPGYQIKNFSGKFRGKVRAEEALTDSLNTPAVRLLRDLGMDRTEKMLTQFGVFDSVSDPDRPAGLSLALGGRESNLLALTHAYSSFAAGHLRTRPVFLEHEQPDHQSFPWHENARMTLLAMMRSKMLPHAEHLPAAWKTGTSNNNRDAWCIAIMPDYTVGVWYGNKNSKQSLRLVGAELAAPAAGKMLSALTHAHLYWAEYGISNAMLCSESGLAATPYCKKHTPGRILQEIPLRRCAVCRKNAAAPTESLKKMRLFSPVSGKYRTKKGLLHVKLECDPGQVHVYRNGSYTGIRQNGDILEFPPGTSDLLFWCGEGYEGKQVKLRVQSDEI